MIIKFRRISKTTVELIILVIILSSCNKYEKNHGYLVFTDSKYFQFVPTKKNINKNTSISSFESSNLVEGFQFVSTFNLAFYHSVFLHLDTFKLENADADLPINFRTLKILPINIEYEKTKKREIPADSIKYKIRGREIICKWNFDVYKIHRITFIPYKNRNLKGNYIEDVAICPPSDEQLAKIKESLNNIEKSDWFFK